MRKFIITIAFLILFFSSLIFVNTQENKISELKEQNIQLLREIEQRKIMTKDMKRMALTAECSVIKVDTDFTSREILWSLSDILIENGCEVKIH